VVDGDVAELVLVGEDRAGEEARGDGKAKG
jgi:hypothetical protein